jgi:hypothetical protein
MRAPHITTLINKSVENKFEHETKVLKIPILDIISNILVFYKIIVNANIARATSLVVTTV